MKNSSSTGMKTSHNVCLPNLLMRNKAASKSGGAKQVSSITIMDRLREAVLRLIMLTAISKSSPTTSNSSSPTTSGNSNLRQNFSSPSSRNDPHHSQAVAECIEFIKKKSAYYDCNLDEDSGSGHESSSSRDLDSPMVDDETPQLPLPFSVM